MASGWESEDELLRENTGGISAFPAQDEEVDEDALLGSDDEGEPLNLDDLADEDLIEVEIEDDEDAEWIEQNTEVHVEHEEEQQPEEDTHLQVEQSHSDQTQYNTDQHTNAQQHSTAIYTEPHQQPNTIHHSDEVEAPEEEEVLDDSVHAVPVTAPSDDESEDEDDGNKRGDRFKQERTQITPTIRAKAKSAANIPDTLEMSHEAKRQLNNYEKGKKPSGRGSYNNNRGRGRGMLGLINQHGNRRGMPNPIMNNRVPRPGTFQPILRPGLSMPGRGNFMTSQQRQGIIQNQANLHNKIQVMQHHQQQHQQQNQQQHQQHMMQQRPLLMMPGQQQLQRRPLLMPQQQQFAVPASHIQQASLQNLRDVDHRASLQMQQQQQQPRHPAYNQPQMENNSNLMDIDYRQNMQYNNSASLQSSPPRDVLRSVPQQRIPPTASAGSSSVVHVNPHFKGTINMPARQQQHKPQSIEESFGFPLPPTEQRTGVSRQDPLTMFQEQTQQQMQQPQRSQQYSPDFTQQTINSSQHGIQSQFNSSRPLITSQSSYQNNQPPSLMQQQPFNQQNQPHHGGLMQQQQQQQQFNIPLVGQQGPNPVLLGNRPQFMKDVPQGQPIQTVTGMHKQQQQQPPFRQQSNPQLNRGQSIPTLGSGGHRAGSQPHQQQQPQQKQQFVQKKSPMGMRPQQQQPPKPQQQQGQQQKGPVRGHVQQRLGPKVQQGGNPAQARNMPVKTVNPVTSPPVQQKQPKTAEEKELERKKQLRAQRFSSTSTPVVITPKTTPIPTLKTAVKRLSSGSVEKDGSTARKQLKITRTICNVKPEPSLDEIYSDEAAYKQKEEEQKRQRELIMKRKEAQRLKKAYSGTAGQSVTSPPQTPTTHAKKMIIPITMTSQPAAAQQKTPTPAAAAGKPQFQRKISVGANNGGNKPAGNKFSNNNKKQMQHAGNIQAKVTAVNRKIQQWNKNSNMYGKKGFAGNIGAGRGKQMQNKQQFQNQQKKKIFMSKEQVMRGMGMGSGANAKVPMADNRQVLQKTSPSNLRKVVHSGQAMPVSRQQNNRQNNRNVVQSSPQERPTKVVVENIASNTTRIQLGTMAKQFGPYLDLQVDAVNKRGYVIFKNSQHAHNFVAKKNHAFMDMAIIKARVVTE